MQEESSQKNPMITSQNCICTFHPMSSIIILLLVLNSIKQGVAVTSNIFRLDITDLTNGQHIPIGQLVPVNIVLDVLQADADFTKYEFCAKITVINGITEGQCLSVDQLPRVALSTDVAGRIDYSIWIQNRYTKILASNRKKIFMLASNYSTGHEECVNQTDLYQKCLMSGSDKCAHHRYDRFYWKYLPVPRGGHDIRIGEVGLDRGTSLRFWKSLYPKSSITVLEIKKTELRDLDLEDVDLSNVTVVHGDQTSVADLGVMANRANVNNFVGFDIFVDDGSHVPSHQKITFDKMFRLVKPGGVYIIEDIETSFVGGQTLEVMEYFAMGAMKCVNGEFHGDPCPFNRDEPLNIESFTIAHNMIIFSKSLEEDQWLMNRPYRFGNGTDKDSIAAKSMSYFNVSFLSKRMQNQCDLNLPLSASYKDPDMIRKLIDAQLECAMLNYGGKGISAILLSDMITNGIKNATSFVTIDLDDISVALLIMKQIISFVRVCDAANSLQNQSMLFISSSLSAAQKIKLEELASGINISMAHHPTTGQSDDHNHLLAAPQSFRDATFVHVNNNNKNMLYNIINRHSKLTKQVMLIYGVEKYFVWEDVERFLGFHMNTWVLQQRCIKSSGLTILKRVVIQNTVGKNNNGQSRKVTTSAAIVEPRNHAYLNYVILNVFSNLPLVRPIHVFHGMSVNFTQGIKDAVVNGSIILHQLNATNFDKREYSALLTSKEFWLYFRADKVLIFQTDSVICSNRDDRSFPLSHFLEYDYIGGRAEYLDHGNGGLSLRDRKLSLICSQFGGINIGWEDTYFSNCIKSHGGKMANFDEQEKFAAGYTLRNRSFGAHKINQMQKSLKTSALELENWRHGCPDYLEGMQ